MQLDPVTTWAIILLFVIPAGIGWATIFGYVHGAIAANREPARLPERSVQRLRGDRRG